MSPFHRLACSCGLLAALAGALGCASSNGGPGTEARSPDRNPDLARRLTAEGREASKADPARAEALFREAIAADLFYGPAHNNLGVIHLQRGELYEAAQEFEWARKLMPGHPDPRLNLGLTLEAAGRIDEAILSYEAALEVYPDHLPSVQALTACQLKHERTSEHLPDQLSLIALRATDPYWREWARLKRAGHPPAP